MSFINKYAYFLVILIFVSLQIVTKSNGFQYDADSLFPDHDDSEVSFQNFRESFGKFMDPRLVVDSFLDESDPGYRKWRPEKRGMITNWILKKVKETFNDFLNKYTDHLKHKSALEIRETFIYIIHQISSPILEYKDSIDCNWSLMPKPKHFMHPKPPHQLHHPHHPNRPHHPHHPIGPRLSPLDLFRPFFMCGLKYVIDYAGRLLRQLENIEPIKYKNAALRSMKILTNIFRKLAGYSVNSRFKEEDDDGYNDYHVRDVRLSRSAIDTVKKIFNGIGKIVDSFGGIQSIAGIFSNLFG